MDGQKKKKKKKKNVEIENNMQLGQAHQIHRDSKERHLSGNMNRNRQARPIVIVILKRVH